MQKFILVVDDDPLIVETLSRVLEHDGYRVRTACDGIRALDLMSESRPDLVLTDVRMPAMDGVALVLAMRVDTDLSRIPTVMMSFADESPPAPTSQVECAAFIPKPPYLPALFETVRRLIGAAQR